MASNPAHDNGENWWGRNLVENDTSRPIDSLPRLRSLVLESLNNEYILFDVVDSGSTANERAVNMVSGANSTRCLLAMGCYVAGNGALENFGTSKSIENSSLSVVAKPDEVSSEARERTVALPYYVPCSEKSDAVIVAFEEECLKELDRKLIFHKLFGIPYKALLLELILSGCGGELSDRFLRKLGILCEEHDVVIIVDEVMTGGRVGPTFALTTGTPAEFKKRVEYITIGKTVQCGLLLRRCHRGIERGRGATTTIPPGKAYQYWSLIQERISSGMLIRRRDYVLQQLEKQRSDDFEWEYHWGRGLLIFLAWYREKVYKGMKCRILPTLDERILALGPMALHSWTRSSVCKMLLDKGEEWRTFSQQYDARRFSLLHVAISQAIAKSYRQVFRGNVNVTPAQILDCITTLDDANNVAPLVADYRRQKTLRNRNIICRTPALRCIQDIFRTESKLKQKAAGNKRKLGYIYNGLN